MVFIRWEDRRHNANVLMKANTTTVEAMVVQNQLRWAGHCFRMSENRLPRQVLFVQLTHGVRKRGDQIKLLKDTANHYMKKGQIDINAWELISADRPIWRRSIYQATTKFETNRLLHEAEKRQRRKEREISQHLLLPSIWHLLLTLQQYLQTNNPAIDSPQDT